MPQWATCTRCTVNRDDTLSALPNEKYTMNLRIAYNTNGVANHRFEDALALIADSGYDGVALTLDVHHLDPYAPDLRGRATTLARWLRKRNLGLVIETGARFLLDPRQKHEPTLLSPDQSARAQRIDFLARAIEVAAICEAEAVSFWAGVPQPMVAHEQAWDFLLAGIEDVTRRAERAGVQAALEPEPGMLIETIDDYKRVKVAVPNLRLALDLGHLIVTVVVEPTQRKLVFSSAALKPCTPNFALFTPPKQPALAYRNTPKRCRCLPGQIALRGLIKKDKPPASTMDNKQQTTDNRQQTTSPQSSS